ncbi:MAG: phage scaffolding protein [Lachnospiraceae bacterium]|nr:phage scaffolding protein [Lachnospiraceae bacterium]
MDILELLKKYGVELPEDQEKEFNKEFRKTYKSEGEVNKAVEKVEKDRDAWKERAETAETALTGFEGKKPEEILAEMKTLRTTLETTKSHYENRLAERDLDDAIARGLEEYKFTSEAAKREIVADIKKSKATVKEGKILGLSDMMAIYKEKDPGAFVDEQQENLEANRARAIGTLNNPAPAKMTKEQIMQIKNRTERQKAIAENMDLFRK